MSKSTEQTYEELNPGFDLRVQVWDPRTGALRKHQPYRAFGCKAGEGTRLYFERPVGSGNLFFKSGQEAGRFAGFTKQGDPIIDEKAAHVDFVPVETQDDKLRKLMLVKDDKITALEKELSAIRRDKKYSAPSEPTGESKK